MRYWYSQDEDDWGFSTNAEEAECFQAMGYEEISREEWEYAMRMLKG